MAKSAEQTSNQIHKRAVILDLDGTLALRNGRGPYDELSGGEDDPNRDIIELARIMSDAGYPLLVVSGRSERARAATRWWLHHHLPAPVEGLYMRGLQDKRPDSEVKAEIYERSIKPLYNVFVVLDDRAQTVAYWRSVGLTCLQVAPGDF